MSGQKSLPTCKTCESGTLRLLRVYKFSVPILVIGYICLAVSFLSILFCLLAFFNVDKAVRNRVAIYKNEVRDKLADKDIPYDIIEEVIKGGYIGDNQISNLSIKKQIIVLEYSSLINQYAETNKSSSATTKAMIIGLIIGLFVSSLIGWLLIMKKKVLKCGNCSATVSAG